MALVDQKTPRLGLLLPFTDNFLQDDVERLRDTFNLLDVLVVTRDQTTGKIADDMLSDVIAKLDAQGKLNKANLPSTVVQTGPDGKIDGSLMPSIAVVDTFPVPNEASMLGLQCERGDIAIREDLGKTFILTQMPPSTLSNWRELTSTNVTSVNGKTGAITGLAASGANNDITSLNALSGPLRLGGDASGDYDAVTLKQLRAASGGAGGASMNGVMNNFIGAVEWFNGTRAKIPAGYVPADGQVLSRLTFSDLAAAVDSGMLNSQTEALWINSGDAGRPCAWRSSYSQGGAAGTAPASATPDAWFRVPDLNGMTANAIKHLFLSGSSGSPSEPSVGQVWAQSMPNITGKVTPTSAVSGLWAAPVAISGQENAALTAGPLTTNMGRLADTALIGQNPTPVPNYIELNANRQNNTYGRGSQYQTSTGGAAVNNGASNIGDLYPNHAVGIWIIRASGTFQAQNTNFNVINGDTAAPANNTVVAGGYMVSAYQIGGLDRYRTRLFTQAKYGVSHAAVLAVENLSVPGTVSDGAYYQFGSNGLIDTGRNVSINMGVTNNLTITANGNNTIFAADGTLKSTRFQAAYAPTGWNDWYMTPGNPAPFDFPTIVGTGDNAYLLMAHRASRPDGWPQRVGFGHYVRNQGANSFGFGVIQLTGDNGNWARFQFNMNGQIDGARQQNNGATETFTYAMSIVSDRKIKDDVTYVSGDEALANIDAMEPVTFIFKSDEKRRVRRGFIAQDLERIDPQYVKDVTAMTADGKDSVTTKTLDNNVLLLDALAAIKVLSARLKLLESAQK